MIEEAAVIKIIFWLGGAFIVVVVMIAWIFAAVIGGKRYDNTLKRPNNLDEHERKISK